MNMSKKHKTIVGAMLILALLIVLPILGQRSGFDDGREAGMNAGVIEGQALGRQEALGEGSQWYCVHAADSPDSEAMFCMDDAVKWSQMCAQAKAAGEGNPGLTILGCPIGTFIPVAE